MAQSERWEGSEVARQERWEGIGGKVGDSLFYSRVGGRRVRPKFHLFVSDANQRNEGA